MRTLVSIIVPTRNSEKTVEMCLESIRRQTYPNIEIIIVDAYSEDSTKEIAERYGAKIVASRAYRSEARNIGAEKTRGQSVLFLDSDMKLEPTVVQCCVDKQKQGYDAVIIPETSIGIGFWAKCKALEKSCYIGDATIEAARFFGRSVFEDIGGYDPELESGEDWDLSLRISRAGHRIGRVESYARHYEGRLSLRETIRKKHGYGKTLTKYRKKHPTEASQQLTLIRPAFLKKWKKLANDPAHATGMFFMKTCEFATAWLGFLTADGSR